MNALIAILALISTALFASMAKPYGNKLAFGLETNNIIPKVTKRDKLDPVRSTKWFLKSLWSGIGIVDGRGKINGSVASQNRFGSFVRTKVSPINRNTSYQTAVRATFGALATGWANLLTELERAAFRAFAADHPFSNIFGKTKTLTGMNMYVALNAALQNAGMTQIVTPPTSVTTGQVGALTLVANHAAGGTLTVATNELDIPVGSKINVFATKLMSAGRTTVKSQLNFITSEAIGGTPYDIKAAWIAKYGAFPGAAGGKIFVVLVIVTPGGWLSIPAGTSTFVI